MILYLSRVPEPHLEVFMAGQFICSSYRTDLEQIWEFFFWYNEYIHVTVKFTDIIKYLFIEFCWVFVCRSSCRTLNKVRTSCSESETLSAWSGSSQLLLYPTSSTPNCRVIFFFLNHRQEENGAPVRAGLRGDNSQEEIEERTGWNKVKKRERKIDGRRAA